MKIHVLGICGTFMGSLAILARNLGFEVSGQDLNIYPPMSTQLQDNNITVTLGYAIDDMPTDLDLIVIGNVMRRGMPIVEFILKQNLNFISGPEFIGQYVLRNKHVLVVTGTHGKTTCASLLAWILQYAGLNPGYLIGGVPNNFGISASLGGAKYFVIEGDEYDCAFFDKRSKFLHYKPQTVIINNIEYDHADIFPDLSAILMQFHYLMRIVPGTGLLVYRQDDLNIKTLFDMGTWTPKLSFALENAEYNVELLKNIKLPISLLGEHNKLNALAAIAAASNVGVSTELAVQALHEFTGVKRRLELKGKIEHLDISIYSDFAHHPTAIKTTLAGFRSLLGNDRRIIAVVDICSNTMKAGVHKEALSQCMQDADKLYFFHAVDLNWDLQQTWRDANKPGGVFKTQSSLLSILSTAINPGDCILLMSNGSFEEFTQILMEKLHATQPA